MSSKPLHLLIVELPGSSPRHYLLQAGLIRIGRVEGNALIVEEETVSSRHCELRRLEHGYEIADLGSTNGTRVNGERIDARARPLREGDTVQLGLAAVLKFVRIHEIREPAAEPLPVSGARTQRLERLPDPEGDEINPVAAAVAKAARANSKAS